MPPPRRRMWPGGSWEAHGGPGSPSTASPAYGDGHDSLIGGDDLSDGERDALLELCRQRLDAFREQRGEEVTGLLIQKPAASATAAATAARSAAR